MNTETALAHIETYIAGGDELGEVSDADALTALETLRKQLASAENEIRQLRQAMMEDLDRWHIEKTKILESRDRAEAWLMEIATRKVKPSTQSPTLAPDITPK